jgi:hypothetical protein
MRVAASQQEERGDREEPVENRHLHGGRGYLRTSHSVDKPTLTM